jgi:hypothetical protein
VLLFLQTGPASPRENFMSGVAFCNKVTTSRTRITATACVRHTQL